jgi:threonine aldolase
MRQVGILAAGALYAVQYNRQRLTEDHANAKLLAEAVRKSPGLSLDPEPETNIVVVRIDPALGSSTSFSKQLADQGIGALPFGPSHLRFVTHLDVTRDQVVQAGEVLEKLTNMVRAVGTID